jgi:hypothetical protein
LVSRLTISVTAMSSPNVDFDAQDTGARLARGSLPTPKN